MGWALGWRKDIGRGRLAFGGGQRPAPPGSHFAEKCYSEGLLLAVNYRGDGTWKIGFHSAPLRVYFQLRRLH